MKLKQKRPYPIKDEIRWFKKFAFFPIRRMDGKGIWLEYYYEKMRWSGSLDYEWVSIEVLFKNELVDCEDFTLLKLL